jgi:hypothetical protein
VGSTRVTRALLIIAVSAVLVLLGFLIGANRAGSSATPRTITGTVRLVGINGDEFGLTASGSNIVTSYGLSTDTLWRNSQLAWNSGSPIACMRPLSHGQVVTIGVVNINPTTGALGTQLVAWVECAT